MQQQYKYVTCRATGHSWDQIPTTRRPAWGTLLTFRCIGCGTVREDVIDGLFNLSVRKYYHPEDYQTDAMSRADWRKSLVSMNREMVVSGPKKEKPE